MSSSKESMSLNYSNHSIRPSRKAATQAKERLEEYKTWKKATSGSKEIVPTPVPIDDQKYMNAIKAQLISSSASNRNHPSGSGYHYDRDF